jgi:uncharacterized protein YkwD
MRKIIYILFLVMTVNLYGQCGSLFQNGIEYKIPCDWDYLKHSSDSLRKEEKLFIKYLNEERVKRNLQPLVFDQSLYDNVAVPQANKMAQDGKQSHTTQNVFECVGGVFYGYKRTNLAKEGIEAFQFIAPKATYSVHWRILMNSSIKKVSVAMSVSPSESDEKEGVVYISVVML